MRVENVKRPLKLGEVYDVPCISRTERVPLKEEDLWLDLSPRPFDIKEYYCPVINLPHTDVENGQIEAHYHADTRFLGTSGFRTRVLPSEGNLVYKRLEVVSETISHQTPVDLIKRSKFHDACLKNGRCPHKGYDLSQVEEIDGTKTCPLHGLKVQKYEGQWRVKK